MPRDAIADAALVVVTLLYPAYLTYKTLEHDRKRADNARAWCVYWVVASAWTAAQPALDRAFAGRAVMYWECKVRRRDGTRDARDATDARARFERRGTDARARRWRLASISGIRGFRARCTCTIGS